VTVQKKGGTNIVVPNTPYNSFIKGLDKALNDANKDVTKCVNSLKAAIAEFATAGSGPLVEARQELEKLKGKAAQGFGKIEALKKNVARAKHQYSLDLESEKNAHLVAREQRQADGLLMPCRAAVSVLQTIMAKAEVCSSQLTKLSNDERLSYATPRSVLKDLEGIAVEMKQATAEAQKAIKEAQLAEALKDVKKGPMLEARKDLAKLLAQVSNLERKVKGAVDSSKDVCNKIAACRAEEVATALRAEAARRGCLCDELFNFFVGTGNVLTEDAFTKVIMSLEGLCMPPEHAALVSNYIQESGITRRSFASFVQCFYSVRKPTSLTDVFELAKCNTLRKCEVEEKLETLEGPCKDPKSGLTRIKARALKDGVIGWVTTKGNQGTPFLELTGKPFYVCQTNTKLEKEFDNEEMLRAIKQDEVFELLEGPRKVELADAKKAKVRASKDGAVGWVTLTDSHGNTHASQATHIYIVNSAVAMTDTLEIKNSKVIKKLAAGDLFVSEEEPKEDGGIRRLKGNAMSDDTEGWVTLKGNAGTDFVTQTEKHYTVVRPTRLSKGLKGDLSEATVREVEVGEALEIIDGPKVVKFEPLTRIKGKMLGDGLVGWINMKLDSMKLWTASYKAVRVQALTQTVEEDSNQLREIANGEVLEHQDGPSPSPAGNMRVKVECSKDKQVGWVSLRDKDHKLLLKN
jgi:hypothetical protein